MSSLCLKLSCAFIFSWLGWKWRHSVLVPLWICCGCHLGVEWFALLIHTSFFSSFAQENSLRRVSGAELHGSVCYAQCPHEASYHFLPASSGLCPSDNPSQRKRAEEVWERVWDTVRDESRPRSLLSPAGVFCCLWTIGSAWMHLCGASCMLFSAVFKGSCRSGMTFIEQFTCHGMALNAAHYFHVPAEFWWHLLFLV